MSAVDDLSPIARYALWVSCMDSNVPVPLSDPGTLDRVAALLRTHTSRAGNDAAPDRSSGAVS